jgi:hypothetical protein
MSNHPRGLYRIREDSTLPGPQGLPKVDASFEIRLLPIILPHIRLSHALMSIILGSL